MVKTSTTTVVDQEYLDQIKGVSNEYFGDNVSLLWTLYLQSRDKKTKKAIKEKHNQIVSEFHKEAGRSIWKLID